MTIKTDIPAKAKRVIETPEEFNDLKRECVAVVKYWVDKAADKCGVRIPYPRVQFDIKGATAGTAQYNPRHPELSLIRFSPTLLRENANHFLESTTGHEVAHLIARAKYGNVDPHGVEWGRVMWAFSLPATRCHNYDISNVSTRVGKVRKVVSPLTKKTQDGIVHFAAGAKIIEFD